MGDESKAAAAVSDQGFSAQGSSDDHNVQASPLAVLLEHPTANDIDPKRVNSMFKESDVWVLGFHKKASQPGGTDILHFTIDDESGKERVMLPTFTSREALRQALTINKEWRNLTVLEVHGGDLLTNLKEDVTVVVDPWTTLEYRLPPGQETQ